MKIRFYLLLLFSIATLRLAAQSPTLLHGTWKYHDVYEKEKIDAEGLKMLQMFFGNMTMTFQKDGRYSATLLDKLEDGSWNMANDGKTVTLNSTKGKSNEFQVVSLSESDLIIKVGQGVFILKKTENP